MSFRCTASTILFFPLYLAATSFAVDGIPGDLAPRGNPDGALDVADLLLLEQLILSDTNPTVAELMAGDVAPLNNPDRQLNAGDIVVLQRAVLGQIALPTTPGDTTPPPADISLVSVTTPAPGQAQVVGDPGTVTGNYTVIVINYETGAKTLVSANGDGSFVANVPAEIGHTLSLSVQSTSGNQGPSVSIGVGDIVELQFTSPSDGALVNAESVLVTGTINAPTNTGITVNGQIACVSGNRFYAQNVMLSPGNNDLTVTATTLDGITKSVTHTVLSNGPASMASNSDSPCGYAEHTVNIQVVNSSPLTIQKIDVDFDNDGIIDLSTTEPTAYLTHTYHAPGVYLANIVVTDGLGSTHTLSSTVVVNDIAETDTILQGVYSTLKDRLGRQAKDGALNTVNSDVYDKYRDIFSRLDGDLSTIVDQLGVIGSWSIGDEMAEYVIERDNGNLRLHYLMYLLRGEDGVWRISAM